MSIPVSFIVGFVYLRSLTLTGVEHVAGGLFIVLTALTAQPCRDEQGINGTPG